MLGKKGFIIATILLISSSFMPGGNIYQYKNLALLVAGSLSLAVLFWEKQKLASALLLLITLQFLRLEGMSLISLRAFFFVGCVVALFYFCETIPRKVIVYTICSVAIIQALYGILQFFYDPIFTLREGVPQAYRIIGTFGQRQYWLMFLAASTPLFFEQGLNSKIKFIGLVSILGAIITHIAVLQRPTFVEMAGVIVVAVFFIRKKPILVPAIVGTLLAIFYLNFASIGQNKFYQKFVPSIDRRIQTNKLTMELITANKTRTILGYGLDTYSVIMPQYEKQSGKEIFPGLVLAHAHNEYLQAWFELGIPGAVIMLLAFGLVVYKVLMANNNFPYWASLFMIGLFAWVHFPLHLPFMSLFFLRGKEFAIERPKGFYSGCPREDKKEVRENGISRVLRPTEH